MKLYATTTAILFSLFLLMPFTSNGMNSYDNEDEIFEILWPKKDSNVSENQDTSSTCLRFPVLTESGRIQLPTNQEIRCPSDLSFSNKNFKRKERSMSPFSEYLFSPTQTTSVWYPLKYGSKEIKNELSPSSPLSPFNENVETIAIHQELLPSSHFSFNNESAQCLICPTNPIIKKTSLRRHASSQTHKFALASIFEKYNNQSPKKLD